MHCRYYGRSEGGQDAITRLLVHVVNRDPLAIGSHQSNNEQEWGGSCERQRG